MRAASETGSISVVAGKPAQPDAKPKAPTWMHGLEFRVRKAGEAEFGAGTKKWGMEVFRDENNGSLGIDFNRSDWPGHAGAGFYKPHSMVWVVPEAVAGNG